MINVESAHPPGWLAIPTGVTPRFLEFWDCFVRLHIPQAKGTGYTRASGPSNAQNRNNAVRNMLGQANPQWISFWDDDHDFDAGYLIRQLDILYSDPTIDAVASSYARKYPPFAPVMFKTLFPDPMVKLKWSDVEQFIAGNPGKLMPIVGVGAGGLLVRRQVFEKLEQDRPLDQRAWFESGPQRQWGGDLGLCMKMRDAGMKIVLDPLQTLGHLIPVTIMPKIADGKVHLHFQFGTGGGFQVAAEHFAKLEETPVKEDTGHQQ